MGRRTVLVVVAALIALLGAGLVFLYAHQADNRAEAAQQPVQVLQAVAQIDAGETLKDAQSKGKLALGSVPRSQALVGAVTSVSGMENQVAQSTIYPHEQIIAAKFGADVPVDDPLQMAKGNLAISVNLSDTGRVAGFVSPGSSVAIFTSTESPSQSTTEGAKSDAGDGGGQVRLLLPKVKVIAVGATTTLTKTTTTAGGAQTTEQLPKTLFTLSLDQRDAEKVMYANTHGDLTFGLLNSKSRVVSGPGVGAANLFTGE